MERTKHLPKLATFYGVGLAGHRINVGIMKAITPFFILGISSYVLYTLRHNKKILWWSLFVFLGTFLAEIIGVQTGLLFGDYNYGSVLGPKIFGAPLLIGVLWVITLLGSMELVKYIFKKQIFWVSALVATLFDVLLEPVAITLGYWTWDGGLIPLYNYITWFALGLVSCYFAPKFKSPEALQVFILQTFFFVFLGILL